MEDVLHKPLREITQIEELIDLFYALPEKHIEKLLIIYKLRECEKNAIGEDREKIQQSLRSLQDRKQEDNVLSALRIPWGDWSRVYRVRGLRRAIEFAENLVLESDDTDPNLIYNLAFKYYIAYSFFRDNKGARDLRFRKRALALAQQAKDRYHSDEIGKLEHFMARMGGLVVNEWRKNLPEYCTALACNIMSLISLLDEKYEQALFHLNEAFEPNPTPPEIYFTLGIYFLRKRMFNPSIRMLNESIKRKGEHSAEAYYQLGRAYYLKSQYFIQQFEQEPQRFKTRHRLRKLIDKRISKALDAFQASLAEDPYFPLPYYWMGLTHLLKDKCVCDEALDLIRFSLTLDPKTIYRYLKTYPLTCRSHLESCNQIKLIAGIKGLLDKIRPDPQDF